MAPNILQLQREVEGMPDERLAMEAQGNSPHSLVAVLELSEREQMRNASHNAASPMTTNTVADRLIERAMSGIGSIPQQLSPEQEMFARQAMMDMSPEQMMQQQMMMQSPMPQPMADGGLVGYQHGGYHDPDDPALPSYNFGIQYPDEPSVIGHIFGRELPTLEDIFGRELPTLEDIFEFLGGNQSGPRYHGRSGALITEGSGAGRPQRYSYDPVISGSQAYYGPNHSLPTTTPEMLQQWLGQRPEQPEQPQEDRGIASILASMQAPVFGREAMDVSEYYEMTPEERRLLEFYGSGAQSLESRIDTESDRLSAQANILSNVARAMARGQVPTVGEPLRELQTAQRGRREGIMDESRAMEMAALAQEAGLSRAEQKALMERAMVEDERGYQEAQRQRLTEERLRFAEMLGSEDERERLMARVMLGVPSTDATGNALLDQRQRLLNQITELAQQASSADAETLPDLRDHIVSMYSEQAAALGYSPERLRDIVEQSIIIQSPENKELFMVEAQLSGAANGGLFKDTYQIEF